MVIPKIGDSVERIRELAMYIRDNLGEDTPFHLLRFSPNYQVIEIPSTSLITLERACEASSEVGLNYVYVGNVPGHRHENTYCPNCRALLVKHYGFGIEKWCQTQDMRCLACGHSIAIKGRFNLGGLLSLYISLDILS